jgi:hypothetical protein
VPFGLPSQLTTMQTAGTRRPSKRNNLTLQSGSFQISARTVLAEGSHEGKSQQAQSLGGPKKVTWVPSERSCELLMKEKVTFRACESMKKLEPFLQTFQFVKGFDWVVRHRFFLAMFSSPFADL